MNLAARKSTRLRFWNVLREALPGWRAPSEPDRFCDQLDFYHPDGHRLFFQFPRRRFGLVIAGEFNTDLYWNGGSDGAFHGPGCMRRLEKTVAEVLASYHLTGDGAVAVQLEKMKTWLREERRLKPGCDYAITHKYGRTHALCHELWVDTIRKAAEKFHINLESIQTYE
jgi:hypothetical protein